MRLVLAMLVFLSFSGCISEEAPKITEVSKPIQESTPERKTTEGAPPPRMESADHPFVAHEGWIEANEQVSAALKTGLTGRALEEQNGAYGWFFLEPNTRYTIYYEGNDIPIRTLPIEHGSSIGVNHVIETNPGSTNDCQLGGMLRDATLENIYAITGAICGDVGDPFIRNQPFDSPIMSYPWPIGEMVYENEDAGWGLIQIPNQNWQYIEIINEKGKPGGFHVQTNWTEDDYVCAVEPIYAEIAYTYQYPCAYVEGNNDAGTILHTTFRARNILPGAPVVHGPEGEQVGIHITERSLHGGSFVSLCAIMGELHDRGYILETTHKGRLQPGNDIDPGPTINDDGILAATMSC